MVADGKHSRNGKSSGAVWSVDSGPRGSVLYPKS